MLYKHNIMKGYLNVKIPEIKIVKIIDKINENLFQRANRILNFLEKSPATDSITTQVKEIVPFYNKFLPKFMRRTSRVEFFPNSTAIKTRTIRNNNGIIIQHEQFDTLGNPIYYETFNPRTQRGFVREIKSGRITESEFKGDLLIELSEYDIKGNLIYHERFNPKD